MTRDEISALLPFLVNGTLDGAERAEVEAAVAADPDLRAEVEVLRAVRRTMQDEAVQSPGEMGLARLMRDVRQDQSAAPPRRTRLWQAAAAVLLAVAIGQGTLLVMRDSGPGYELAGGAEADFTLAFQPDTSEADLRALLLAAGVEIVGGPSALGLYSVAVSDGVAQDDAYGTLAASPLVESVSRDAP